MDQESIGSRFLPFDDVIRRPIQAGEISRPVLPANWETAADSVFSL
jgi:hypothetical protein